MDNSVYVMQADIGSLPGRLRGAWRARKGLKVHAVPSGSMLTLCRLDAERGDGAEWLPLPAEVTCRPCAASLKSLRADPRRPLGIQPPEDSAKPGVSDGEKRALARIEVLEAALEAERDWVSVCAFWRQLAGFLIAQEPEGELALGAADLVAALRVRVTCSFEADGSLSVAASYPRFTDKFKDGLVAFTRGGPREVKEDSRG